MNRFESELQAVADRVVAQAKPGEQVEAFVTRGGETDVRIYQGAVEHFVSAQSEGVGIRVISEGRTGFAYAGTLDESAISEVLAEARDNVQFGEPDEYSALAEPDGVAVTEQSLWKNYILSRADSRHILSRGVVWAGYVAVQDEWDHNHNCHVVDLALRFDGTLVRILPAKRAANRARFGCFNFPFKQWEDATDTSLLAPLCLDGPEALAECRAT